MNNLVIVESPTKARTLARFLGNDYQIEASMGHVRDLPKADLGVDTENNFEPKYIIPRDKKKKVNELKKLAANAKTIWLATDPDREGEAIAWHLGEVMARGAGDGEKKKNSVHRAPTPELKRVVFHEITESAIKEAFLHPRDLDEKLIDAQQARRVLDRLVGYKLSPLLWRKVKRGLSAGRVQTVALRLIVEREREIEKFKPVEHWSIEVEVETENGEKFWIELIEVDGKKLEVSSEMFIHNKEEAENHVKNLEKSSYSVEKVTKREVKRSAPPPFTTSTLQQAAGNRLGMTAKKTMMLAQNLYEHGLITYMRTDSVNLSQMALGMIRSFVETEYGKNYLPASPRMFRAKSRNAQEAHEAIRPTEIRHQISDIRNQKDFTRDHARLYELIWKRAVASQMNEAVFDQTTIDVEAGPAGSQPHPTSSLSLRALDGAPRSSSPAYLLRATGSIMKFDGWLKLYGVKLESRVKSQESRENTEDNGEDDVAKNQMLPEVMENDPLKKLQVKPDQHFTEPPPRYTEASLVKKLEELGIGRPSTYAPILSTIQERFYVERNERKFVPTALGLVTSDFLVKYFPEVFDYAFTAQMEDKLDEVSRGEQDWHQILKDFYAPFEGKIEKTQQSAEHVKLEIETVDKNCPKCGKQLVIRTGRFGKFLACSGFPDCKHTEAIEVLAGNLKCPDDGADVVVRRTKKGRTFYGCKNYPECKWAAWNKPK